MKVHDHKKIPAFAKASDGQGKKMKEYNHTKIERKWQLDWEKKKIFSAVNGSKKPKFYALIEFPYLSGSGLHIGHIRSNTAMDIISRKRRMEGYNVMYPIGYDAFGLPTENYAIKTGKQPTIINKENTKMFRRQLKKIGFAFDWTRELNTADQSYYKWTQWIFLQMFKKGLAYKQKTMINWCPKDKIGLANEEVVNGKCERCGEETVKKEKEQWMLAITKYADRLYKDLDDVDYLERIKAQQRNWIGRKEGINITYPIDNSKENVTVFTTRPDTNYGATFIVLAPENILVEKITLEKNKKIVQEYIKKSIKKSEEERISEGRKKTGVFTGRYAINHLTGKKMPIWVSDFVVGGFGTGAVVGVPGHDVRDFEFAKEFELEIVRVVIGKDGDTSPITEIKQVQEEEGTMVNSEILDGMEIHEATKKIMDYIIEKKWGEKITTYHLRDWIFSRQRYWGEPIPLIHCPSCAKASAGKENCGWIPVPDKDLPVVLPKVKSYKPTDTGESPLANISKWVNVKCPKCGGKARRETDTMPNWAGSSWYYLRYTDPKNKKEFASIKNLEYWLGVDPVRSRARAKGTSLKDRGVATSNGVDWYNGGMEHTTLHLLYSRFWHKFLYDLKLVPTKEPYKKRTAHGMILAEDGEKMSKSRGNVVNPDDIVKLYGADTFRLYEMFIGPFDQTVTWNTNSIIGPRRFLEKVWKLGMQVASFDTFVRSSDEGGRGARPSQKHTNEATQKSFDTFLNKTIKKVTEDIESMSFNTAVSSMMVLVNEMLACQSPDDGGEKQVVSKEDFKKFLQILSPFAPHITEELWEQLKTKNQKPKTSIHLSKWPKWDEKKIIEEEIKIAVQINGKVRAEIMITKDISEDEIKLLALKDERVVSWTNGKEIKKFIYIPNRIINIVV